MSFLIRAAFWLSLVILILPSDKGTDEQSASLSATQAITVAQATLSDFTSFCSRQPDVCAAGEVALENFSAKARYGAKQLYVYLDGNKDASEPTETEEVTGLVQAPGFSEDQGLERQELTQLVNNLQ